jgi:hypothetical protein
MKKVRWWHDTKVKQQEEREKPQNKKDLNTTKMQCAHDKKSHS